MLGVDAAVVSRGAGDLQLVAGQRDDGGIAAGDRNRGVELEVLTVGVLLHRFALENEVNKRPRRAVEDRRFGGVHLDHDVVDAAAVERAEHVLDGVDLGVTRLDGGRAHEVRHQVDPRLDLGRAVEIGAAENDTRAGRGGLQTKGDLFPGVERGAFHGDLARERALLHA